MTRVIGALVLAACLAVVAAPQALAQPPAGSPPAAQDGFVPVTDLPAAEQLPAAPLVIGAYAFIWVAALAYLWIIWRRLGTVERELHTLRRTIESRR